VAKELGHLIVSVRYCTHTRKHVVGSWEEAALVVVRDDLGTKVTGIYAPRGSVLLCSTPCYATRVTAVSHAWYRAPS